MQISIFKKMVEAMLSQVIKAYSFNLIFYFEHNGERNFSEYIKKSADLT